MTSLPSATKVIDVDPLHNFILTFVQSSWSCICTPFKAGASWSLYPKHLAWALIDQALHIEYWTQHEHGYFWTTASSRQEAPLWEDVASHTAGRVEE